MLNCLKMSVVPPLEQKKSSRADPFLADQPFTVEMNHRIKDLHYS